MGSDAIRIGLQIRRFLVISIRVSYRSVCNHPFLVGMVCFLLFLYRSFPFLFSLLVSASPVLACTAVLLGTLLSFGEANIPEIEEEEDREEEREVALEVSQLKARVVEDATVVVNKGNSHSSLRFRGKRRDGAEKTIEESLVENESGKMGEDDVLDDYVPLIDESSQEIHSRKQVINDKPREIDDLILENNQEIHEENRGIKEMLSHGKTPENQYCLVQNVDNENFEEEENISPGGHFDFSQDTSWKRANTDDEEEEDEKASDSESEGAESSSPDASMADIIPMLHELHPLLDEEAPEQPLISHQGSYAGSERSHKSKLSSVESEEDMENEADEEDADDDNDNEEEEEVQGDKEDESKSAIKWTEDDQKNLMDLGTSELERNQRLENLIARRRARRNMRLMAEKNLIDLDGADLPVNVPPISTTRHNPFDLPYDPYDDVPGSAPSILLPRQNPFDMPYDFNEEKPDLKRDSFQQEFSAFQHREPVFRRHESFSVGPSVLGGPKQERQDFRWKPYFVPERYATEGTSYRAFQRQLSEASDSKVSSIPDTESVSSAVEEEDSRANEDVCQETERVSSIEHASTFVERGSQSSEDIDALGVELVEKSDICQDEEEITLGEVENHRETDLSLSASGGTTPVEQNTTEILLQMEPSEEEDSNRSSLSSLVEVDEKVSDLNTGSATLEPRISEIEDSDISTQISLDSDFQCREPILGSQNDHFGEAVMSMQNLIGSDSKFTSAGDTVADDNQNKVSVLDSFGGHIDDSVTQHEGPVLEPESIPLGGSGISIQNSLNSDFCFPSGVVADNQHKEPLYDSSPHSANEFLSFSSVSSSTLAGISEMGSPPTSAEFSGHEILTESKKKDVSREIHESSSQVCSLQENDLGSRHIMENDEEDADDHNDKEEEAEEKEVQGGNEDESKSAIKWTEFDQKNLMDLGGEDILQPEQESHSGAEIQVIGSHGRGEESDFVAGSPRHMPSDDFTLSAHDEREMSVVTGQVSDASCTELDQPDSSILDVKTIVGPCQDEIGELDSTSSSFQMAFENRTLPIVEEQHPPVVVKSIPEEPILCSQDAEHVEEHAVGGEHILQLEQEPHSGAGIQVNGSQGGVEELDFVAGSPKHMPSDNFNLSPHDEREMSVVTRQVSGAFPDISSSETKHLEEHPLRRDKTILSEQDPVHSSNSDVTIDANSHQDVDVIVASSSYQHVHSDEKSLLDFEKRPCWADKSIIEPSSNDHGELQEPSGALARIPEEVNNTSNISALNIHDHEDKLSRITTSFTSDSTSVPSDSPEYKTPATGLYLKNNILDKFVYKDSDHVLERSNSSAEAYGSPMGELYEDYIEIKEIDEGLLSELDAVGDFSVKEVLGESLHDEQMTGENNSGSLNSDMLPNGSSLTETKTEIPVLKIRSIEDFDLAFEQLHERADVGEVIPPKEIKDQFFEHEPSGLGQTSSEMLVAEAKSLEDVHITMNQDSRENFDEPSRLSNSKDVVVEVNVAGSTKELPVLEVQTVEHIGLAFKPLQEGADVEDVIIPSVTEQSPVANELKDPGQTSANLQVVEARSLEDINTAMKQALEGNTEEQSRSLHLKDELAKGDELGSTNEIPIPEARTFEDINLAFKQLEEGADVEEVILPSSFEQQLVVDESNDSGRTNSHLHVVQAKSLEDIHDAMKQVSGSNTENIPEAADPKDGWEKVDEVSASEDNTSRTLEANDVNFTKDMEAIEVGSTKESR